MKKFILSVLVMGFASAGFAEPTTVPSVDLNKYIGKWYEVASIPQSFQKQCVGNTTAEYSMADRGFIKVLNSCDTKSGARSVAEGRAKVVDSKSNSKLKVTFVKFIDWIFSFGGNYWILDLGPNYSYAVVGDPSLKYAWILSRQPTLSLSTYISIEAKLKAQGYDTCSILTSVQTGGFSKRQPLCEVVKNPKDIVDTAVAAGNFKTLLAGIQMAGLEETLRSEGPFTVFFPTDEAFAKVGEETLNKILADESLLTQILTYHVVAGEKLAQDIAKAGRLETVNGKLVQFTVANGEAFINGAKLVVTNIQTANGVIHVLDSVLIP
ncbi:lipocalin family protein [Bdellovibrio svalbardensis]|uniref:Lipocalin family protein n=1 Tax=Bdellovibrio svalbardensis TaxID=2972972 RepID=A0ABT6DMH7_9BACT|nr:lipocalin family protein [Bdellovibrio svalbardensis]MDG0817295.1 lipocalin family protein [Bdellovibrio svalbardensis]